MIHEIELQNPASLVDPAREPQIGVGRGGIAAWVVVYQDERVGRMHDHWLKDFSRVGKRFIDGALTNRADFNEVLFCIEKDDSERFSVEKPHFGTKVCDCKRTIDG